MDIGKSLTKQLNQEFVSMRIKFLRQRKNRYSSFWMVNLRNKLDSLLRNRYAIR